MLKVKNISTYYGNIRALNNINLEIEESEIVTLIGSNGAGKTTTLNTISGIIKPHEGEIIFKDKIINNLKPYEIARLGIIQIPEGRKTFPDFTVYENLIIGSIFSTEGLYDKLEEVYELFPRIKERLKQKASTLSGGEQQMLVIGRALLQNPKLLMVDEPSMGLSPILVEKSFKILEEINKRGTAVLLVEQNAKRAIELANRGYVIQVGKIVISDNCKNLINNENVNKIYLGG